MKRRALPFAVVGSILLALLLLAPAVSAQPPVETQLAVILDGSGSLSDAEWDAMVYGLADAVRSGCIPLDGSVELTVVQFSTGSFLEVGPVVLSAGNADAVANQIDDLDDEQDGGGTCIACGFYEAQVALTGSTHFDVDLDQIVNLATDGEPGVQHPSCPAANSADSAVLCRDNMLAAFAGGGDADEIDAEGIGLSTTSLDWLRDSIVWPQPGYEAPPFDQGPGWVRQVADAQEFAETVCEKMQVIFDTIEDADLVVEKEFINQPAVPGGGDLIFEVRVRNAGPSPAANVQVHDVLLDLEYLINDIALPLDEDGFLYSCESGLTCTRHKVMPVMGPDEWETLTFYLQIPSDAHITQPDPANNCVNVTALNPDPVPENNNLVCVDVPVEAQYNLDIEKIALTPEVVPGGWALFEVVLTNNGPSDATNLFGSDWIDSGPGSKGQPSPDWNNLYIPAGQSVDVMLPVEVWDTAVPGDEIVNCAQVEDDDPDDDTACASVMVVDGAGLVDADMDATATIVPLNAPVAGDIYSFEVWVENHGPGQAQGVQVLQWLRGIPDGWTLVNDPTLAAGSYPTWECGQGLTCQRQNEMPVGRELVGIFDIRLPPDAVTHADSVTSHGLFVVADNPDPFTGNNWAIYGLDVGFAFDLDIEKIALTPEVAPGGWALYEVVITNNGPSDATNLFGSDWIDSGPGTKGLPSPDWNDLYIPAGQTRDVMLPVEVWDSAVPGDEIVNCAEVWDEPGGDMPNQSCASVFVVEALPYADVQVLSVTALNQPWVPGSDHETVMIEVVNNGPAEAYGAVVTFALEDAEYRFWENFGSDADWNYSSSGGTFTRLNPMPVGEVETLYLDLALAADAHYATFYYIGPVRAMIASASPDGDMGNNSAASFLDSQAVARLAINKRLFNDGVAPGGTALYEIIVCNQGPSDIAGIGVYDLPGVGLDAGSVVLSRDADWFLYVPAGQCTDVMASVKLAGDVAPGDDFCNSAAVDASLVEWGGTSLPPQVNEPTANEACGTVGNYLPEADIDATTTIVPLNAPVAGEVYMYEVWVENHGDAPAEGVTVHQWFEGVPNGWTLVNDPTAAAGSFPTWECGQGLTCTRTDAMPVGKEHVGTFHILLPSDTVTHGLFPQRHGLFATIDNPDPNLGNNWVIQRLDVEERSWMEIDKIALADEVAPGGFVLYEIVVTNLGPSDAEGVTVFDYIDYGPASVVRMSPDGDRLYIPAGETRDLMVVADVWDSAAVGDVIGNCAEVFDVPPGDPVQSCVEISVGEFLPPADIDVIGLLADSSPATAGTAYNFRFGVRNNGPGPAEGVIVHDLLYGLPGDWIVTGFAINTIDEGWLCEGHGITCSRAGSMAAGTTELVAEIEIIIPSDTVPGSEYFHDLQATADNPDPNLFNNWEFYYFDVLGEAVLDVQKSDLKDPIGQGENLIYEITVQNEGPSTLPANSVFVTDSLPVEVEFVGASPECWLDGFDSVTGGELVVCMVPDDLDPDETYDFLIQAWVPLDIPAGTILVDLVWADTPYLDPEWWTVTPDRDMEETEVMVGELADLKIIKVVKPDDLVNAGEPFTYTIYVDNLGPTAAMNLTVSDTMTSDGDYTVTYIDGGAGTCEPLPPIDSSGQNHAVTFQCTLDVLEQFDRWTIIVGAIAVDTIDVNNMANVFAEYPPDPNMENNYAFGAINVEDTADVGIDKMALGAGPYVAGQFVRYLVTVDNGGPSEAENVVVEELLASGVTVVQYETSQGDCTTGFPGNPGAPLTCGLGNLIDGASAQITVTVQIDEDYEPGVLENDAMVLSDIFDPNGGNNRTSVLVSVVAEAEMLVQKSGPTQAYAGDEVEYLIRVENNGPSMAWNVQLLDTLNEDGQYFSLMDYDIENGDGSCFFETVGDIAVHCGLGDIAAGDYREVYLRFLVDPDAPDTARVCDLAVLTADPTITIDPDSIRSVCTDIDAEVDLTVVKTSEPQKVFAGEQKKYTIEVTNHGPSMAEAVELVDTLPDGTHYEISIPLCEDSDQVVTCDLGDMARDEVRTIEIWVMVDPATEPGTTLENEACVTSDTPVRNREDDCGYAHNYVQGGKADLDITKFGKPDGEVMAGEPLIYTVIVDNLGPGFAHGVVLSDVIRSDGEFELVEVVSNRDDATCVPGPGTYDQALDLHCELADPLEVISGDTGRWMLEITVTAADTQDINNVARVLHNGLDPNLDNNEAFVSHEITDVADLEVTKYAEGWTAEPAGWFEDKVTAGSELVYTLIVENHGPSAAENVVLTDQVEQWAVDMGVEVVDWDTEQGDCATGWPFVCGLGTIEDGDSVEVEITVIVPSHMPCGMLENDAMVTSDIYDDDNGNNFTSNLTEVDVWADVWVEKDQEPEIVLAGQEIYYDIWVWNDGPSDAGWVLIEDSFPEELYGITWQCTALGGAECPNGESEQMGNGDILQTVWLEAGWGLHFEVWGTRQLMPDTEFTNTVTAQTTDMAGTGHGCVQDPDWENNEDSVTNEPYMIYLPVVFRYRDHIFAPDLRITWMEADTCNVRIWIVNEGRKPVFDPFHIDVYINPSKKPTKANQKWEDLGQDGVVFRITEDALPLKAGQSMYVDAYGPYYVKSLSHVDWGSEWLHGKPVYAQVDSFGYYDYAEVNEDHEIEGGYYNNIFGRRHFMYGDCIDP